MQYGSPFARRTEEVIRVSITLIRYSQPLIGKGPGYVNSHRTDVYVIIVFFYLIIFYGRYSIETSFFIKSNPSRGGYTQTDRPKALKVPSGPAEMNPNKN